ncbi:unnamed protein product [Cochlearia groenlandica]
MKPGGSALNPYAAAYVPLSKREGYLDKSRSTNPATHHVQQQQPYVPRGYGVAQGMGSFQGSQMPNTSSSYKQMKDEELDLDMDMDMEFLLVTFSGLSHESINDVYLANNGDLDATIEMLNQLEIYSSEAQEYLPDTLDIGDFPETTESSLKNAANNEASATSSSSSFLGTFNTHVSS